MEEQNEDATCFASCQFEDNKTRMMKVATMKDENDDNNEPT